MTKKNTLDIEALCERLIFCFKHVKLICNPNIETYQGVTSVVWLLDYPLTWWQKCGKRGRTERLEESEQPQNVWMTSLTKLRCCRLLLFWSGENLLHCNLRENGSALLLQFCGKFILLLTFHNFKAFSLIEICWWMVAWPQFYLRVELWKKQYSKVFSKAGRRWSNLA